MQARRLMAGLTFALTTAVFVPAQFLTPSFETGLGAWTATPGVVAFVNNTPDSFFPTHGTGYLDMQISSGVGPAIPGHGPHSVGLGSGNVGQVYQDFVRPVGGPCSISLDWEFIQNEGLPSTFNDFVSIDVIDPSTLTLVANVVFLDTGALAGSPPYNGVPGAGGGAVTYVPTQTLFTGTGVHAPAGAKRAWVDLTATTPGHTYRLAISLGNAGDATVSPRLYVDNVRLNVGAPNAFATLRVLGAPHDDGTFQFSDAGGDYRPEAPYDFVTAPGQRLAFRATTPVDGVGWALLAGSIQRTGLVVPGLGTFNLDTSMPIVAVFDGINPSSILEGYLGTLNGSENFYSANIPTNFATGEFAVQGVVENPAIAPFFLTFTAATNLVVGPPRIPVGTTELLSTTGGPMGDDTSGVVDLTAMSGGGFPFYGVVRTELYVNANGNITFGGADSDWTESATEMVTDPLGRIALLWDDLQPDAIGKVRTTLTPSTLTVSFTDVRFHNGETRGNNFAAQLYSNGVITLYYGSTTGTGGLIGISSGGLPLPPGVVSQDLSTLNWAIGGRAPLSIDAILQVFGFYQELGLPIDDLDVMTLGISGPSRITFVPGGTAAYSVFTGTR